MSNFKPDIKALLKGGSKGLRTYFNAINKRRKIGKWNCSVTKFYPKVIEK